MLVRLLYASRAQARLTPDVIDAILLKSRQHNPAAGITGVLCHNEATFMQALEGGREAVSALYNRIAQDPRHADVMLLRCEEITERRFASWSMGQVNLARVNPAILLKYSTKAELNPYAGCSQAALAMLEELIATACVATRQG